MAKVSFSPEWWNKILLDYRCWMFAFCREAGQNSLDAGATSINVTTSINGDGNTVVTWTDNGSGMTRDTLTTRFMAVGGSLKAAGASGGFGIAKLILAFAHLCYVMVTGGMRVTGKNDEYDIKDEQTPPGMSLTTTMKGNVAAEIEKETRRWVSLTTTRGHVTFTLNGESLRFLPALPAACSVQDWCTLHVLPSGEHGINVRINGQYMFSVWSSANACYIVELTGSSLQYLTSNRDGLQWTYREKLDKLVELVTRDPDKLCDIDSDVIEIVEGDKGAALDNEERARVASVTVAVARRPEWSGNDEDAPCARMDAGSLLTTKAPDMSVVREREARKHNPRCDFVVLNKTNKSIPHHYTFDGMRPMEWALFDRWTRIVVAVARILNVRRTIRTGWIFSASAQAAYKHNPVHGSLVLLNPCKLVDNDWKKGFTVSKADFYCLVSLAVHELTHVNHSGHDESYAGAFTDNLAMVLANMKEINGAR